MGDHMFSYSYTDFSHGYYQQQPPKQVEPQISRLEDMMNKLFSAQSQRNEWQEQMLRDQEISTQNLEHQMSNLSQMLVHLPSEQVCTDIGKDWMMNESEQEPIHMDTHSELLMEFSELKDLQTCSVSGEEEVAMIDEEGLLDVSMANDYKPTTEEQKELKLEVESHSIVEIQSGLTLILENIDTKESDCSFPGGHHSGYSMGKTIYSDPFDVCVNTGYIRMPQVDFKSYMSFQIGVSAKFFTDVTGGLFETIFTTRGGNNWLTLLIRGTYSKDFSYRQISLEKFGPH